LLDKTAKANLDGWQHTSCLIYTVLDSRQVPKLETVEKLERAVSLILVKN